jgi:selenophosphate synthase
MRLTIEFPDDVVHQLEARAAGNHMTLAELLRSFIEQGLAAATKHSSAALRSALPNVVVAKPLGRKVLSNASLQALLDDEDVAKALKVVRPESVRSTKRKPASS